MSVVVVPYDGAWPRAYEAEAARVRAILGPVLLRAEHVGSTAVPGLSAKPIVDIAVTVASFDALRSRRDALAAASWEYEPEFEAELPQRRYFRRVDGDAVTHHLHAYEDGHPDFEDYLLFRDHLRAHPEVAAEYERLKADLAARLARADYTAAKAPFIQEVIASARAARAG